MTETLETDLEVAELVEKLVTKVDALSRVALGVAQRKKKAGHWSHKEYATFIGIVTSNCAAYIERVVQMDREHLVLALKDFDAEVEKYRLLPEDK